MNIQKKLLLGMLLTPVVILMAFYPAFREISYSQNIDLSGFKTLQADVSINGGSLKLSALTSSTAELKSTYTRAAWKPRVEVNQNQLSIRQPEEPKIIMMEGDRNDWELKLPANIPTSMVLKIGAGEGTIELNNSKLENMDLKAGAGKFTVNLVNAPLSTLNVKVGTGELIIDLSGKRATNVRANIDGGIGAVTITLPKDAGIKAKVTGLGDINAGGLKKHDGYFTNELYGKSSANIDLVVHGGLGSIEFKLK